MVYVALISWWKWSGSACWDH